MDREQELVAEARAILGPDVDILGAGVFGIAELTRAQVAGGTAGAVAAELLPGGSGAAGAFLGGIVAKDAAARAAGATLQLLVAVTAEDIHVLNRDSTGSLAAEFATFPRASTEVVVERFGASRYLTLTERSGGSQLTLHGSVSWLSAQASGDKVILGLLADRT